MHALERDRKFAQPLRIKDVYERFMALYLTDTRPDWDNWSDDVLYLNHSAGPYEEWQLNRAKNDGDFLSDAERKAHQSFANCKMACRALHDCLQFTYYKGVCSISHALKHGDVRNRVSEDSEQFMSGWNIPRISQWVKEQGDCKGPIEWPVKDP